MKRALSKATQVWTKVKVSRGTRDLMEVAEFAGAKYDINYVKKTLRGDLAGGDGAAMHRLDIQGYLELYLWPHYNQSSCDEHALSIMMLMNEKIRNNINIIEINMLILL